MGRLGPTEIILIVLVVVLLLELKNSELMKGLETEIKRI
jgi:Sec-independent protein translocase protein TatA